MTTNKQGFLHDVHRVRTEPYDQVVVLSLELREHLCLSQENIVKETLRCFWAGNGKIHEEGACPTHRDHPVPDSQCAVSVRRAPFCDARDVDSLKTNKQMSCCQMLKTKECPVLLLLSRKEIQEGQRGQKFCQNTSNIRLSTNATVCNAVRDLC